MEAQRNVYKQEAYELLGELETALLALEEAPNDAELIGRVFRALHTLKGSGSMFGFDDIATFTHEVETVFDLVRNGRVDVTKALVDLTLEAGDVIRLMLDGSDGETATDPVRGEQIIAGLKGFAAIVGEPSISEPEWTSTANDDAEEKTYRIFLQLAPDILSRGTNPVLLLNELRDLGECRVIAHTEAVPVLGAIDPERCYTSWDFILTSSCGINAIKDVFIFVEDECELRIDVINTEGVFDEEAPPRLGQILVERGYISEQELQRALRDQKRIGEVLVDAGLIECSKVEAALVEQEQVTAIRSRHLKEELSANIRVPAERLDTLVNLVGELVTVQARLSQAVVAMDQSDLLSISEEVDRLTAELRDNTMSIRMLPIATIFSKFKRLVRDLSNELGKDIVMVTEGGETELDKTVIERLNDPLVHLIRNCVDHGIEPPQAREHAGKSREGTVRLAASHSGAHVLIRISDDGIGLDAEAIRSRALEQGLIAGDAELTDKEVFALIFAPGFSTAKQITNVSGRGVGMDVVKRSIDSLRGSIDINSERGQGTTITLKLPLTLAIIDGLLVQIGEGYFVLPLSVVEECVELSRAEVEKSHGRHITHVRGEIVPYMRLRDLFRINGDVPNLEQIVITGAAEGKVGFVVDKVIGEHQTVIKNLGSMYRNVDMISGATILGDGKVALIVDVERVVSEAEAKEQEDLHIH